MTVAPQTVEANSATTHARDGLGSTLFRVAWLAILLGFRSVLADLIGKVSWSALVCAGLALGTGASKVRAPFMGLLGLLAAPLAFHVSRTLQQGVAKTLEVAAAGAPVGSYTLILLALLKAVEYGCLGAAIGWIGRRPWGGALAHLGVGLAVGILFGGAIVSFTYWTAPEPLTMADLFSRGANEILFPVGCSLVSTPRRLWGASRAIRPKASQ